MVYKADERKEAIRLRKRGMSYNEIKEHLDVAKSTLSLWLRDIKLSDKAKKRTNRRIAKAHKQSGKTLKRSWRNKRRLLVEASRDELGHLKLNLNTLAFIGAALYWAEGAKSLNMEFSNSDPDMLAVYITWLKKILGVPNRSIRCTVHVYLNNGLSLEEIESYWADSLEIPKDQFRKAIVNNTPKSSKKKTGNVLVYGTLRVTVKKPMQYAAKLSVILERMGKETNFVARSLEFR